jgi:hypothetical protein
LAAGNAYFELEEAQVDALLDAIYIAEGGQRASVPYGLIYQRYCRDEVGWCAHIAADLVRTHYERWAGAGRRGEFLEYLARRWAPIGAKNDPGGLNRHWLRNVRWALRKQVSVNAVRG